MAKAQKRKRGRGMSRIPRATATEVQPDLPGVIPKELEETRRKAAKWLRARREAADYTKAAKVEAEDLTETMRAYRIDTVIVDGMMVSLGPKVKAVKHKPEKQRREKDREHDASRSELEANA